VSLSAVMVPGMTISDPGGQRRQRQQGRLPMDQLEGDAGCGDCC
jgi:hypothetical protein